MAALAALFQSKLTGLLSDEEFEEAKAELVVGSAESYNSVYVCLLGVG